MTSAPKEKLQHLCAQHSLQTIAFDTVATAEPVTLEYLMKDYVVHLKHHLKQIFDGAEG
jgi:hypothetical protein